MSVLQGIRVIDAATYIAGPSAATVMSDFGANVIKVEPPTGDAYRGLQQMPGIPEADTEYLWHLDNRNKRSLRLDLSDPDEMAVMRAVIAEADIFITNHPHPVRRKLGLEYEDLAPLNPRLIYASLTGFGETGPEADNRGYDLSTYWARSGLMHLVRNDMDGPPAGSVAGQGDHPTGIALFGAIMLALFERVKTGHGREVHTSLIANGLWSNACLAQAALARGEPPVRKPREAPWSALVNLYRSRDQRWFIFSALQPDRDWRRLVAAIDRPHLLHDPNFETMEKRRDHARELVALLDPIFAEKDWADWKVIFDRVELQAGPVYDTFDAVADAQARASGAIMPGEALPEMIDSPMWLTGVTKTAPRPAPSLDQHGPDIRAAIAAGRSPWTTEQN
ncbi:MAG: CaiB/BaiF CoA transferase family protein [Minwuia sp.]|uniref:CaiB/BaiF CoA transferase family protein n=1 Tax=Minwuia sp. TaxID=2493630 RepID=UPI003A88E199